jgi:hypothetical protein
MKAKLIIFPYEDGFHVVAWGTWIEGSMRTRSFDNRTEMIALLETLHLIGTEEAQDLDKFSFMNSCPLYTAEIDEETLEAHGFRKA